MIPTDSLREQKFVLVGGGCRSGKSRHAVALALRHPGERYYLASAVAFDDEMRQRIDQHRLERQANFATVEESVDVDGKLVQLPGSATVLFDCATIWITNLILAGADDSTVLARVDAFCTAAQARIGKTIVVSNEVGSGIVPENALARRFRDLAGFANQRLAGAADAVVYCLFGLPKQMKP